MKEYREWKSCLREKKLLEAWISAKEKGGGKRVEREGKQNKGKTHEKREVIRTVVIRQRGKGGKQEKEVGSGNEKRKRGRDCMGPARS